MHAHHALKPRHFLGALALALAAALPAWSQTATPRPAATAPANLPDPDAPARRLMADLLIDMAETRGRDLSIPAELGGKEALVLLEAARKLNPNSAELMRLMAEAAIANGDTNTARDCLRNLIKADPGNLVAQVQFLDLMNKGKPVEEQLKAYEAAYKNPGLDAQVRSEAAVRIGRLLTERGSADEAREYFKQAIVLNDVNVRAWQEFCRQLAAGNAAPADRLQGLIGLLLANPFQPDALVASAHVMEAAGQHSLASDWLIAALEQFGLKGLRPVDIYWELAVELAIAGRRNESEAFLHDLLTIENGPPEIPMVAYLLKTGGSLAAAPASAPATDAAIGTAPAADPLLTEMRKRYDAAVAKDEAAMPDAVRAELLAAPTLPENVTTRLATLRGKLGPENPTYRQLEAWKLLRDGKLAEAKTAFEALAGKDLWAKLGLARVAAASNDKPQLQTQLTELWDKNPQGLLALEVVLTAQFNRIELKDTALGQTIRAIAAKYPNSALLAHRQPRDTILVTASPQKHRYGFGEPVWVNVKLANAVDRPLSAGPGGAVSTSLAIGGTFRGIGARDLGFFGLGDHPRVFRLDKRTTIETRIRADQGILRDVLYANPTRMVTIALGIVTAPRLGNGQLAPGLSGQRVLAGDFERDGVGFATVQQMAQAAADLPRNPLDRQMLVAGALTAVVSAIPEDQGEPAKTGATQPLVSQADLKKQIVSSLLKQLNDGDPLVQAWMVYYAPYDLPEALKVAIRSIPNSANPLVRMLAYRRAFNEYRLDPARRADFVTAFKKVAADETDPLAKRWELLMAEEADLPLPAPPSTQPAGTP